MAEKLNTKRDLAVGELQTQHASPFFFFVACFFSESPRPFSLEKKISIDPILFTNTSKFSTIRPGNLFYRMGVLRCGVEI